MEISLCTKSDFDQIISDMADFWGDRNIERLRGLHNPVYLYEFGNTAYVVKEGDIVAVAGVSFLEDGQEVKLMEQKAEKTDFEIKKAE